MTDTEVNEAPQVDAGEAARSIAQKLLDAGHLDATAVLTNQDEISVDLVLEGPDAATLIGKQGATLNAFQYLVGLMLSREIHQRMRVTVDAESYRVRRAETLIKMARDLAGQVREHNQEAVMDPLNAAERRIVHTALVDEPGISTYSEGEDPDRRVVISPKAE
jgi:spoIIIJ-associated protein